MSEQYGGHSDIIMSIDTFTSKDGQNYVLTGSKDKSIILWRFDKDKEIQERMEKMAVFEGHSDNICSVNFAPKKAKSFVSVA